VIELTVSEGAPIAGMSLKEANSDGLVGDDVLVVAIERDGEIITPRGKTTI
jgi:Trk K+ transport system NAD-binding subunit